MSAPTSGSSGSSSSASPVPGYYPDPSIPNYIRYWNGSAWVPGTSRPAPPEGQFAADGAQPGPDVAARTAAPGGPGVEESGPMFLDEDPGAPRAQVPRQSQSGPGEDRPPAAGPAGGAAYGTGDGFGPGPDAAAGPGDPRSPWAEPDGPAWPQVAPPAAEPPAISWGAASEAVASGGTPQAPSPGPGGHDASPAGWQQPAPRLPGQAQYQPQPQAQPQAQPQPQPFPRPQAPRPQAPQPQPPQSQDRPGGGSVAGAQAGPASGPAAGSQPQPAGWAEQVQGLARDGGVTPWRAVAADPFGQDRALERPGGLVRRFAARLIDAVLLGAVTAVAAVPLGSAAYHHAKDKVDQAKLTGETVRVWLLDSTTGPELAGVLGVFLLAGVLLEVLPTARWGRTAGKRLVGLRVLDIEAQLPPGFGASLRRWLVRTVLDALVLGVVGTAWCLVDRPWKQGLHDKAARTFVAGG